MTSRILVVCTANVCRSPMVAAMLASRLDPDRFEVHSAGVRAPAGRPMDADSAAQLRRLGVPVPTTTSRQLDAALVAQADLVLTATRAHRADVLDLHPRALRRTFTVREFAALCRVVDGDDLPALVAAAAAARTRGPRDADLRDPIGASTEVHTEVADLAAEACETIGQRLTGTAAPRD